MSVYLKGISEEFFRSMLKSMPALISFEHSEVSRRAVNYLGTQKAPEEDSKDTRALGYSGTKVTRALGHLGHSDTLVLRAVRHLDIWALEHLGIRSFNHSRYFIWQTLSTDSFIPTMLLCVSHPP